MSFRVVVKGPDFPKNKGKLGIFGPQSSNEGVSILVCEVGFTICVIHVFILFCIDFRLTDVVPAGAFSAPKMKSKQKRYWSGETLRRAPAAGRVFNYSIISKDDFKTGGNLF